MNEQIKLLAEQAGLYDEKTPEEVPGFTACFEKFAELIVEECCVIVNQEALLTDHVPAEMNAYAGKRLKNAYIKIEEHFGVEEPPVDNVDRILRTVRTRGTKE
jgi:hypothetical protein